MDRPYCRYLLPPTSRRTGDEKTEDTRSPARPPPCPSSTLATSRDLQMLRGRVAGQACRRGGKGVQTHCGRRRVARPRDPPHPATYGGHLVDAERDGSRR